MAVRTIVSYVLLQVSICWSCSQCTSADTGRIVPIGTAKIDQDASLIEWLENHMMTIYGDYVVSEDGPSSVVDCGSVTGTDVLPAEGMARCVCYETVGNASLAHAIVRPCDVTLVTRNALFAFTRAIIQQGQWAAAFVISDGRTAAGLAWRDLFTGVLLEAVGCGVGSRVLADVLRAASDSADMYLNVAVDCPLSDVLRVLSVIKSLREPWVHVNWLFHGFTSEQFSGVSEMFGDGDNIVVLDTALQTMTLGEIVETLDSGGRSPGTPGTGVLDGAQCLVRTQLYWCLLDCRMDGALPLLGSFSDPAQLSALGVQLLPREFQQFYGKQLVITYMEYRPFAYKKMVNGHEELYGIEVDMVKAMSEHFNFSCRFIPSADGSWDGMINMVVSGQADMAIAGITVSKAREEVIDFLFAHWEDASVVLFNLKSNRWLYFLRTFSMSVWLAVLAMPWVITFVLLVMKSVVDDWEVLGPGKPIRAGKKGAVSAPGSVRVGTVTRAAAVARRKMSVKRPSVVFSRQSSVVASMQRRRDSPFNTQQDLGFTGSQHQHLSGSSRSSSVSSGRYGAAVAPLSTNISVSSRSAPVGPRDRTESARRGHLVRQPSVSTIDSLSSQDTVEFDDVDLTEVSDSVFQEHDARGNKRQPGKRGMELPVRSVSVRIVMATFWLTMIILMGTYSGSLTAALTIRKIHMPFHYLADLAQDTSYVVQMLTGTFREQMFQEAEDPVYRAIWEKIMANPDESLVTNETAALEKVLHHHGYAILSDKTMLQELAKSSRNCDVIFMEEEFFKSGYAMVIRNGAAYRTQFDKFIIHLFEAGLFQHWAESHMSRDHCRRNVEAGSSAVTLSDLTLVFLLVFGLGLGLATAALGLECLVKSYQARIHGTHAPGTRDHP